MSRTYPIEFEHGRIVKIVTPGSPDNDIPIEVTIDINEMEPGTTHRIEINADGTLAIHSPNPFVEVPPDLPDDEVDAYVAAMAEKSDAIRAEFMEELRDTLEQEQEG